MRRSFRPNETTRLPRTVQQYFDHFLPAQLKKRKRSSGAGGLYHFVVSDVPEGAWTIDLNAATPSVVRGLHGRPTRIIRMKHQDLERLLRDKMVTTVVFQRGQVDLSILLPVHPPTFVPPENLQALITLALTGTFIKVDHMDNQPKSPGGSWSFVQFNELLHQRGLLDRDLDVPVKERGLGDAGQWLSLATGGWYVVDRIRFLVNNLHTTLGFDTMTIWLEPETIVIEIAFSSNNPTLQGEGNAYLAPLLGIPIGWSDAAFPDVHISAFRIQLRLVPFIPLGGRLTLHDIDIRFDGNFPSGPIVKAAEQPIRGTIVSSFRDNFNTPSVRDALAAALVDILALSVPYDPATWTEIVIDQSGVAIWGP